MLTQARRILAAGLWLSVIVGVSAPIATAGIPHGRDCATAATIEPAEEVRGAFTGTDDRAVYRLVLERRGLLDVWVDPWELDLWNVELLDSACNAVRGVGAGDSVIAGKFMSITVPHLNWKPEESVWTLDAGVYFLRFNPNPVDVFADPFVFRATYTPHYGHDFKTAQPIAFPSSTDGALLYPEDREVFRLTLTEPGVIHAWATGPADSSALPRINLSFPEFSSPADMALDDGSGSGILTRVLKPGTYYLSLEPGQAGLPGPFTLHVALGAAAPAEEGVNESNVPVSSPLLVRRGGRDNNKNVAKPPLTERTGWSLTDKCLVSDHPVCGADVASRLSIDAAATPPHEEGNAAHPKRSEAGR